MAFLPKTEGYIVLTCVLWNASKYPWRLLVLTPRIDHPHESTVSSTAMDRLIIRLERRHVTRIISRLDWYNDGRLLATIMAEAARRPPQAPTKYVGRLLAVNNLGYAWANLSHLG